MGTEELRGRGPAAPTSVVFTLCCESTRPVGKDLAHVWRSDSEILCTHFTDLLLILHVTGGNSGSLAEGLPCSVSKPSWQLSDCISPGLSEEAGCLGKGIPLLEMFVCCFFFFVLQSGTDGHKQRGVWSEGDSKQLAV